MKNVFLISLLLLSTNNFGQDKAFNAKEVSISKWIDGTLLTPLSSEKPNLAIIIAGSGPTNRNGNQNFLKNNSLKKLAEALTIQGIATFRYDKRIVKQIKQGNVSNTIKFDDFIKDASDIVDHFKTQGDFNKIYIIGHSQGSLVGMVAAKDKADGFISLAGAGQNIGDVIIEQVTNMAPKLGEEAKRVVNTLKKGQTTTEYPEVLASLFSPDIQPFMINWMSYEPTEILKDLDIPLLIINGTKDLQVSVKEAELLKTANEKASLNFIDNMNHVLFEIKGDDLENSKSYNESFRPISPQLIEVITDFIKK